MNIHGVLHEVVRQGRSAGKSMATMLGEVLVHLSMAPTILHSERSSNIHRRSRSPSFNATSNSNDLENFNSIIYGVSQKKKQPYPCIHSIIIQAKPSHPYSHNTPQPQTSHYSDTDKPPRSHPHTSSSPIQTHLLLPQKPHQPNPSH